jgi:hypothetical protein
MSDDDDNWAALADVLRARGSDHVPRRAVLHEGALWEKCDVMAGVASAGGVQEIDVLSAACEIVRVARGLPVYPRATDALVTQCLTRNDPGAWAALYSDMATGDVDWAVLRRALVDSPMVLLGCVLAPQHAAHMLHVIHCVVAVTERATPEHGTRFAGLLGDRLRDFVDVLGRHSAAMRRETRDAALSIVGRMLTSARVPPAALADALSHVLTRKQDDLVRLFVHAPVVECVDARAELVPALLARAKAAALSTRYPLLAVLARLAAANRLEGHDADIVAIVTSTLSAHLAASSGVNARVLLACSLLARALSPQAAAPLAGLLARALHGSAAALISLAASKC